MKHKKRVSEGKRPKTNQRPFPDMRSVEVPVGCNVCGSTTNGCGH